MDNNVVGKVVQVAGPAVDCQFPEGQIPLIYTAIRITSEGFDVPAPIDIICEVEQHIGEGRVRTIALQPTEGLVRGMHALSLGHPVEVPVGQRDAGPRDECDRRARRQDGPDQREEACIRFIGPRRRSMSSRRGRRCSRPVSR